MSTALLPPELSHPLARLERKVRSLTIMGGLGWLVFALALVLGVTFTLDWWFELPSLARAVGLGVFLSLGVVLLVWGVARPWLQRMSLAEVAALAESTHPRLGERLTSAVELADPDVPERERGSALMRQLLMRQTVTQTADLDLVDAANSWPALKRVILGTVALLALMIPWTFWAPNYSLLWARFFSPYGNFARPSNLVFEVENGDRVVRRGSDVALAAIPRWLNGQAEPIEAVRLNWTNESGEADSRRMAWDAERQAYVATLPHVFQGFRYDIVADDARSREYHVQVVEGPAITAIELDIRPPAYTGLPARKIDGAVGEIAVFERSQLTFSLTFNKPLARGKLLWLDPQDLPTTPSAASGDTLPVATAETSRFDGWKVRGELPLTFDATQTHATVAFAADRSGRFALSVFDEHQLDNEGEPIRHLEVTPDLPPTIAFADAVQNPQGRPDDVIPVPVLATDDVGIHALELHYAIRGGAEGIIPADPAVLGVRELTHPFRFDLKPLGLSDGAIVTVRARVADERPVPGPQEAWTEERVITIRTDAIPYTAEQIAAVRQEWKQMLQAIRQEVQDTQADAARLEEAAEEARDAQQPFGKDEELARTTGKLQQTEEKAQLLAANLAEHPLFANLTKPLQDVAQTEIRTAAENTAAAEQAALPKKSETLKAAQGALKEADVKLADIEKKFDEIAKLEQDLLELDRLAGQAERLADDVAAAEEKRRDLAQRKPESPKQAEQAQQDLSEKVNELKRDHSDIEEALKRLMEKRPELIAAAKETFLQKLAELGRKAEELADKQDQLAESMQSEAQQNAGQLEEERREQAALEKDARKLAATTELNEARQLVNPLNLDSLKQAMEALKAGDKNEAAEQQERAANELDKLAEAFARNALLPADPQQAAQELAQRQDALQKKIQEFSDAVSKDPAQEEMTPEQQEARADLAAEQAAIQAAAAQLDVPRGAKNEQKNAVKQANEVLRDLVGEEPRKAAEVAEKTEQSLKNLANSIGDPQKREQQARNEAKQMANEQADLARHVEKTAAEAEAGKPPFELAEPLKQQQKRQEAVAQKLAELDVPAAADQQRKAQAEVARAKADLENQNLADAKGSQQQAAQALSDLEKTLDGKPSDAEEAVALSQQQKAIADQAGEAGNDAKGEASKELARQEEQLAQALSKMKAPAARPQREAAEAAARKAAEQLRNSGSDPEKQAQAKQAAAQAAAAVEQLAEALEPTSASPAEQAQELAKAQGETSRDAAQMAEKDSAPGSDELSEAAGELRTQQRQLDQVRAGQVAQQEKMDAAKALQEAQAAQQKLAQAAKDHPASDDQKASAPVAEALAENAQAQDKAAQALQNLAERLGSPDAGEALAAAAEADRAAVMEAPQSRVEELNALAEEATALAEKQAELQERSREAAAAPEKDAKGQLSQARGAQDKLNAEIGKLANSVAPQSRATAQAESQKAAKALQQGLSEDAENAQSQVAAALRDLAEQAAAQAESLAQTSPAEAPGEMANGNPMPGPADPMGTPSGGEPMDSPPSVAAPSPQSPQLAQQARDLAQRQRELAQRLREAPQPQTAPMSPPMNPLANADEAPPPAGGKPPLPAAAPAAADPIAAQQELAREAAELALDTAVHSGVDSPAAKQAEALAGQAAQAADEAALGQLNKAAQEAAAAGKSAGEMAERLNELPSAQGGPAPELSAQAQALAARQAQVARDLNSLAENAAGRQQAMRQAQNQLSQKTQDLAQQLESVAQSLAEDPIGAKPEGERAASAQDAADQADEQMQQAQDQLAQDNAGEASQQGKQASQKLREAARQAARQSQPGEGKKGQPKSKGQGAQPSPGQGQGQGEGEPSGLGQVGTQVAQAAQNLSQAGEQLDQIGEQAAPSGPPQAGSPMPGQSSSPGDGPMTGDPGAGDMPSEAPGEQPGRQGQPMSPGSQAEQSLRAFAQALRQTTSQMQSAGQPNRGEATGQAAANMANDAGGQELQGLATLEAHLKGLNARNWGELPGTLKTEILQASKRKPDGDYARLIQKYFEEISKVQKSAVPGGRD